MHKTTPKGDLLTWPMMPSSIKNVDEVRSISFKAPIVS
jgi:hypothetical protein